MFVYIIKTNAIINGIYTDKNIAFQQVSIMMLQQHTTNCIVEEYILNTCIIAGVYEWSSSMGQLIKTQDILSKTQSNLNHLSVIDKKTNETETMKIFIPNTLLKSCSSSCQWSHDHSNLVGSPIHPIPQVYPYTTTQPTQPKNQYLYTESHSLNNDSSGDKKKTPDHNTQKTMHKINKIHQLTDKWNEFKNVFEVDKNIFKLLQTEKTQTKNFIIPELFTKKYPQFKYLYDHQLLDSPNAIYHYIHHMPATEKEKYSVLRKFYINVNNDNSDYVYSIRLLSEDSSDTIVSSDDASDDDASDDDASDDDASDDDASDDDASDDDASDNDASDDDDSPNKTGTIC